MIGKRGRPKKSRFRTKEDVAKYYAKRYRELKKNKVPDFQQKDSLLVRITEVVKKEQSEIDRFPKRLKAKLYRYNFHALPGSIRIPLDYLNDNHSMCLYVAQGLGEGEFIILTGGYHPDSKRCTWKGLLRFTSRYNVNNELIITKYGYTKKGRMRMQRYWFRKKEFVNSEY
jgi:hypothetical protein